MPPRACQRGDIQALARRRPDTPSAEGCRSLCLTRRIGGAPKDQSGNPRRLCRQLEALGGRSPDLIDLADDSAEPRLAKALLHSDQHIGVATGFDPDHAIGVESGQIERRRKQVAPAQTPEDRTVDPGKDPRQKDRGGCLVAEFATAGDLMQHPRRQPAAGQIIIDFRNIEGQHVVAPAGILDTGDARAQFLDDGCMPHSLQDSDQCESFCLCSLRDRGRVKRVERLFVPTLFYDRKASIESHSEV